METSEQTLWPEHFACFCGNGQQWWNREQKRYSCNGKNCAIVMTEDPNDGAMGVWMGTAPGEPKVTREEAWHRAPPNTAATDVF
jgi:hypothetical protein